MGVKAVKGNVVDYGRDGIAMLQCGLLSYNLPLIGGLIGVVLGNYIASHKTPVNVVNTLMLVDSVLEAWRGGRGVM